MPDQGACGFHLGLTGGMGSGKSTLAAQLVTRGAALIDADQVARQLTAAGGAAIAEIVGTFGADMLDAQGALNRARMRALVFAQPDARQRLQAILHPRIARQTALQVQQARRAGYHLIVHDIPLLVESGQQRAALDAVLVVDCPEPLQIARVMTRSALTRAEVQAILATQADRGQRLAAADWVIYNDESMTIKGLGDCADALLAWLDT